MMAGFEPNAANLRETSGVSAREAGSGRGTRGRRDAATRGVEGG